MDSGLYGQVLSSPEVIAAALFVILLLPLIFFIASTRSRGRSVRLPARRAVRAQKPSTEDGLDEPPARGTRTRARGLVAGPEDRE